MKNFLKVVCIVAAGVLAAIPAQAVLITNDTFSYADGDLNIVSSEIWSNFSGTTALSNINGQAFVTGTRSKDDQLRFGGNHSNDVLFVCFDWIPTALAGSAGGAYFSLFKDDSTFNFLGRTMVTNDVGGTVRIGIANQASAASTAGVAFWASTTTLGTTNTVVVRLDQTGASPSATLWLNPLNEFSTSITATDIGTNRSIQAWALRQSNAQQGGAFIDNVHIATTFGECIPEPSTYVLVGAGLVGLLALRRRRS